MVRVLKDSNANNAMWETLHVLVACYVLRGHYVWRLTSSAYVFKTPEQISLIFDTLQRHFILNTSVDSIFIKFIIQSGAIWQKLTQILLSTNASA